MDAITWIVLTGIIIWTGIGCYLCFLSLTQRKLAKRIARLELLRNDDK